VAEGAHVWLIPDGYLPEASQGDQQSHEAICVLNSGTQDATLRCGSPATTRWWCNTLGWTPPRPPWPS
jgi:Anabaena sensory rhodopsin transducer